ncbi:MAG: NmrA family NAD(P)-binding protein [Bdellovibrio sp.]|nr:NmrA family NAD(P)-binding protein [Bdellovibrio sp.]
MILVMGATGQVGSKIATQLLSEGHEVRCVARHFPNKGLFAGAELWQGDANEVSFLEDAMRGCSAVFVMIPPNISSPEIRYYYNKFGEVAAECIEEVGIKKVVNLSSVGADLESGTGPILGLHDQEARLNEITHADIVHLRPTSFMENLLSGIPAIIAMNRFFGTVPEDAPVDLVATKDIAARAAFLLANPHFKSHNVEYILGERTLTYREIIRVLGQTIGKPDLEYVEVPDQEMRNYYIGAGMSQSMADAMIEMSNAFGNGSIMSTTARDNTNTTSTSIEAFARTTFMDAYNKALSSDAARRSGPTSEARP